MSNVEQPTLKKLKVLIDFEAISQPFSRDLKLPEVDYPYAYTIAVIIHGKYKSRTKIIITRRQVFNKIRNAIVKDLQILTGNTDFKVNHLTTEFIG